MNWVWPMAPAQEPRRPVLLMSALCRICRAGSSRSCGHRARRPAPEQGSAGFAAAARWAWRQSVRGRGSGFRHRRRGRAWRRRAGSSGERWRKAGTSGCLGLASQAATLTCRAAFWARATAGLGLRRRFSVDPECKKPPSGRLRGGSCLCLSSAVPGGSGTAVGRLWTWPCSAASGLSCSSECSSQARGIASGADYAPMVKKCP